MFIDLLGKVGANFTECGMSALGVKMKIVTLRLKGTRVNHVRYVVLVTSS